MEDVPAAATGAEIVLLPLAADCETQGTHNLQAVCILDCIHALKGVCRLAAITELRRHGPTMAIGNLLYRGC